MKLIISAGNKKREICGPYSICGNAEDLTRLRDAINDALQRENFYGWVEVTERQRPLIDTPPEPWER